MFVVCLCFSFLCSTFQSLPADIQENVIRPAIVECLKKIYAQPNDGPVTVDGTPELRHIVDTVSALTENFPLGHY